MVRRKTEGAAPGLRESAGEKFDRWLRLYTESPIEQLLLGRCSQTGG